MNVLGRESMPRAHASQTTWLRCSKQYLEEIWIQRRADSARQMPGVEAVQHWEVPGSTCPHFAALACELFAHSPGGNTRGIFRLQTPCAVRVNGTLLSMQSCASATPEAGVRDWLPFYASCAPNSGLTIAILHYVVAE